VTWNTWSSDTEMDSGRSKLRFAGGSGLELQYKAVGHLLRAISRDLLEWRGWRSFETLELTKGKGAPSEEGRAHFVMGTMEKK